MSPTAMAEDEDRVKGTSGIMKQAEIGMALFKKEESVEYDVAGATAFKEAEDVKIVALDEVIKGLTGKDNKKAKTEKEKEKKAMKDSKEYIDAEKVLKGKEPQNGFWIMKAAGEENKEAAPAEGKNEVPVAGSADEKAKDKKDKPKKSQESAGISPAERAELDKLKGDIIERKTTLKGEGMSGGQMNKDEQIAAWVRRMNELKEKESPGSTAPTKGKSADKKKPSSTEQQVAISEVEKEIEEYRVKLMTEFKYTKKEISADPDMQDLQAKMKALSGKK